MGRVQLSRVDTKTHSCNILPLLTLNSVGSQVKVIAKAKINQTWPDSAGTPNRDGPQPNLSHDQGQQAVLEQEKQQRQAWQHRTDVSEPSSRIPTLISFAIHHARSSCYIPACQTGNPQVCCLSNTVKTKEQDSCSFTLWIYNKSEKHGLQLWGGCNGAKLGKISSLWSHLWTAKVQVRSVIWLKVGEEFCIVERGRKLWEGQQVYVTVSKREKFNWSREPLACNPTAVSFLSFSAPNPHTDSLPFTVAHPHHTHQRHSLLQSLRLLWCKEKMMLIQVWLWSKLSCSMGGDVVSPAAVNPAMKGCSRGHA